MDKTLSVSSSPHLSGPLTTRRLMLDVLISLVPALAVAVFFWGPRALTLTLVTMAACVVFEYLYRKLMKKSNSIGDLSACVTGALLAFCLPANAPYWLAILGAFFAIVIVKQLFGGLGKNFMNPALAARCFLFSYPTLMTTWAAPNVNLPVLGITDEYVSTISTATPMAAMHNGLMPEATLQQMFVGQIGGCLGEVSAVALIIGGIYLVARKVISPRIPVCYVATVAVLTFLFPLGGQDRLDWMLYQVLGGGLLLGAIFMATDYVTSPSTKRGQVIYAIGCGALTVFIRYFGSYPEGVSYSILVMNACAWAIDKAGRPHRFGTPRFWEKSKEKEGAAK